MALSKPSSNIVNISNVSSEASICSDASSLSLHSTAASCTASPNSEDDDKSLSLNTAMVQKSQLNKSSTFVQETAEPPSHPISQVVPTSLPALLQQSLTLSTTPMVYIPVVEQSVHADS